MEVEHRAALIKCPRCGASLKPGAPYCVQCGIDLTAGAGSKPSVRKVPKQRPRYACSVCGFAGKPTIVVTGDISTVRTLALAGGILQVIGIWTRSRELYLLAALAFGAVAVYSFSRLRKGCPKCKKPTMVVK